MKKSLAIFLLLLVANASFAQAEKITDKEAAARKAAFKKPPVSRFTLGITLGIGGSWISKPLPHWGGKLAYDLGVSMMYSRNEHWGLGAQLIASHEGYRFRDTGSDVLMSTSVDPVYARVPVQVNYFFGRRGNRFRPKVYIGPSFALKVDEFVLSNGDGYRAGMGTFSPERFKTFDAGINSGVGLNVYEGGHTWLNIDLGYYHGLTQALNVGASEADHFNRNLRFNISLMWGL